MYFSKAELYKTIGLVKQNGKPYEGGEIPNDFEATFENVPLKDRFGRTVAVGFTVVVEKSSEEYLIVNGFKRRKMKRRVHIICPHCNRRFLANKNMEHDCEYFQTKRASLIDTKIRIDTLKQLQELLTSARNLVERAEEIVNLAWE